jgi:hypothetical protein
MTELKEKPKRWRRRSRIDFVIPLQLEECLYRIQQTETTKKFFITASRKDDDTTSFMAWVKNGKNVAMSVDGTMRRWQGTSTRIEATGELHFDDLRPKVIWGIWGISFVLFFLWVWSLGFSTRWLDCVLMYNGFMLLSLYAYLPEWASFPFNRRRFMRFMREIFPELKQHGRKAETPNATISH